MPIKKKKEGLFFFSYTWYISGNYAFIKKENNLIDMRNKAKIGLLWNIPISVFLNGTQIREYVDESELLSCSRSTVCLQLIFKKNMLLPWPSHHHHHQKKKYSEFWAFSKKIHMLKYVFLASIWPEVKKHIYNNCCYYKLVLWNSIVLVHDLYWSRGSLLDDFCMDSTTSSFCSSPKLADCICLAFSTVIGQ